MAIFDSADLLSRLRTRLARPAAAQDQALPDAALYQFLGDAQRRVVELLSAHAPEAMLGSLTKLTTSDNGATYTFGADTDATLGASPIGGLVLLASKNGPIIPMAAEWDTGTDRFLWDAVNGVIRWPNQRSRSFADGPYARWVAMPGVIDASTEPTLRPKSARDLIVYEAAALAAERLGMDATVHRAAFDRRWAEVLLALKTQFLGSGGRALGGAPYRWVDASDLGGITT